MLLSRLRLVALLASLISGTRASAGDVDAWRIGGTAGATDAPLSGHSATLLSRGSGVGGGWTQYAHAPLMAFDQAAANPQWSSVVGGYVSAGVYGGWRPRGWTAPFDVGSSLRMRMAALQSDAALGTSSNSFAIDDAATWLRWGFAPSTRSQQALVAEARVDFDFLTDDVDTLRDLSGSGSGAAVGWVERRTTAVDGLTRHISLMVSADVRPPQQTSLGPRQALDARAGWTWLRGNKAILSEFHARGARHWPLNGTPWLAASVEPRIGMRVQPGQHFQWSATVGAGIPYRDSATGTWVQPTGSPQMRAGLELRRVPTAVADGSGTALSAQAGELTISPRNGAGQSLQAVVTSARGAPQRGAADGGVIVAYTPGESISVTADGYVALTMTPPVRGDGPWTWAPTLPPRAGDAVVALHFLDQQDKPVTLSTLSIAGAELGGLYDDATVTVEGLAPGKTPVAIAGALVQSAGADVYALDDPTSRDVTVSRPLGATRVLVTSEGDPVPDARIIVRNAIGSTELSTDSAGVASARLTAGVWKIRVEADGFTAQEQEVEIGSALARLHEVPFGLLPATSAGSGTIELQLVDPEGNPVEGVEVRIGGRTLGTVASGGRIRLEDLEWVQGELKVTGADFVPYTSTVYASDQAESSFIVPVQWQSGRVQLRVTQPDSTPIATATVEVREESGVVNVPQPLGPDGRQQLELPTGEHTLVVSAPGFTAVEVPVTVEADRDTILGTHVVLRSASGDQASLSLAVSSALVGSVEDAQVLLDGEVLSGTSSAGRLTYNGLEAGKHTLSVVHPLHEPFTTTVELAAGDTTELRPNLDPQATLLTVRAEHNNEPISALVRLVGPVSVKAVFTGADGLHIFRVPAGSWEVVFAAEEFGTEVFQTVVRADRGTELIWRPTERMEGTAMVALAPRDVEVRVLDRATRAPVPALVRALGSEIHPPVQTGPDGQVDLQLMPGRWEVVASSPNLGIGGADFEVLTTDATKSVDVMLGTARVQVAEDEVKLDGRVLFEVGSARIEVASVSLLSELARTLQLTPDIRRVRVEGHTDNTGDAARNLALSDDRARAVMDWLIAAGVSPDRLEARGYGEQQPVASNDTEDGRMQNRRVVLKILEREAVGEAGQ